MSTRSCRDIRADLSAYLDGDLDAGLTGEIRDHLERCAGCRAELDLLRLTVGALHRLPDLPAPAAILSGVRARLQPEPWYRRLFDGRHWLLGVPVGALATLLVVVGVAFFQARYPDMTRTIAQGPLPQAPAPEMRARPAPVPPPAPVARDMHQVREAAPRPAPSVQRDLRAKGSRGSAKLLQSAPTGGKVAAPESSVVASADIKDRYQAIAAAPVEPMAPTDHLALASKAEQSQPARPEPPIAASKEAFRESPSGFAGKADRGVAQGRAGFAGEKEKALTGKRIVCLLLPEGDTVDDLARLLRREGAGDIVIKALEPRAVREAFAPYRERPYFPLEPPTGWTVTANIPRQSLARLLDLLANRKGLQVLDHPAATAAIGDPTQPLDLRITVLR